MKKIRTFLLFLVLFGLLGPVYGQRKNSLYLKYIEQYAGMAVEQMRENRIPASITLAQGLLESGAGQSQLARKSNNHFGIKCGNWRGRSVRHDDDAKDECFRAYRHARESYEDHSVFLKSNARYAFLFKLDLTDYKAWARGLKKAGYATDPSYANRLIQIIEDYELYKYDSAKGRKKKTEVLYAKPHQVYISNDLLYVSARRGDTFEMLGKEFDIRPGKLVKYNDLFEAYTLAEGDIVYLQKKNKKASKKYNVCVVGDGDSMHGIAQRYGIRLKNLYKLNDKDPDDYVPEVGDRIWLR